MSRLRLTHATVLALGLCAAACHRPALVLEGDEDDGPTVISVQRFEVTGTFDEIVTAAQAAITGQGGPSAIRSDGQVRFRDRAGRLTLRLGEDGSLRAELVLRADASAGAELQWQQRLRAISRLRGVGRRIVNGQPVE